MSVFLYALMGFSTNAVPPAEQRPPVKKIIVDINGKGDFVSIQAAINSLPDSSGDLPVIYIKKGIYKEKIYIEKNHFILEREDRDATVITQAIARDEW